MISSLVTVGVEADAVGDEGPVNVGPVPLDYETESRTQ